MIFNSITTFLILLVFVLGVGAVVSTGTTPTTEFSGQSSDLHHRLGLSIFLLVMIQASLGVIAHNFNAGHITRKIHITVGIITVAGLYWQVWEGLNNEWAEASVIQTSTPLAVKILFWIFIGISLSAYLLAAGQATLQLFAESPATDSVLVEKNKLEEGSRRASYTRFRL